MNYLLNIENDIDSFKNDLSMANGLPALCLYMYEKGLFLDDIDLQNESMNLFTDKFYELHNFQMNGLSLYGGTTGMYWLYQYFVNEGILDHSESFIREYDKLLLIQSEKWGKEGNVELLYGVCGIGVYFIERYKCNKDISSLKKIVEFINSASTETSEFKFWSKKEKSKSLEVNDVIDLGQAHGMIGVFNFYLEIIESTDDIVLKNQLVKDNQKILNFLYSIKEKSNSLPTKSNSVFPSIISNNMYDGFPSRIGWCYGDLIISYSIIRSGKLLNDKTQLNKGIEIMKTVLNRNFELESCNVRDFCICHGISGIKLIFQLLKSFNIIEIDDLLHEKNKEIEVFSHKLFANHGHLTFYRTLDGLEDFKKNIGFIEGELGILMSNLDLISIKKIKKLLLL